MIAWGDPLLTVTTIGPTNHHILSVKNSKMKLHCPLLSLSCYFDVLLSVHTVDGRNSATQLISSLSHYLQGLCHVPGGLLAGFLNHQKQYCIFHHLPSGRVPRPTFWLMFCAKESCAWHHLSMHVWGHTWEDNMMEVDVVLWLTGAWARIPFVAFSC